MTAELSNESYPKLSSIYNKVSKLITKNTKFLVEDSSFFWMHLFARLQWVRYWKVKQHHGSQHTSPTQQNSDAIEIDDSLAVIHSQLLQNGYYCGIRLKPQTLQELLKFSREQICYGDRDPNLALYIDNREQFETEQKRVLKMASYLDTHELCRTFQHLKRDPLLQEIATQYLGQEPKYHRGELLWSFPRIFTQTEKISLAQVLHCDINDYRTIKFFFYLVDVDNNNGPHRYVKGSHRNRSLLHQLMGQHIASIADPALINRYGPHQVTTVCGSAGLGFVGDPYVLHQGITPTKTPRLLLQLEFGIKKYKTWYFETPE